MTSETQTISGQSPRIVGYDYDADGLRTNLDYPSGVAVENQWTALGQLDTVSADGPPPLASYSYDKAGRLIEAEHENGITQDRGYDAASQLLNITHTHNGVIQSGHSYQYDKAGRRTSESFLVGSTPARTYSYDAASQVTAADYGAGQTDSFNYDAMGNRTSATIASQGGGTFNYGSATKANQYTSITGRSAITHDANGNQLLNGAGAAFTWDSENRLLTVTPVSPNLGDKAHVHSYDGLHRRVTRTTREWTSSGWTNLETTYFIYDGWNVIEEWTSTFSPATTATLTRRLTWGQDLAGSPSLQGAGGVGGLLMVEEITSTTNEAYHFHYDGNGNVTEITDHLGVSVATYRYDAFGNTLVANGSYAATNRYRFSTKPLDHEVTTAPLYYYGYRYYDPVTGRWPSRDPIGEAGGVNLYGFVGNNSINSWDYIGLKEISDTAEEQDPRPPTNGGGAGADRGVTAFGEVKITYPNDTCSGTADIVITITSGGNAVTDNFLNNLGMEWGHSQYPSGGAEGPPTPPNFGGGAPGNNSFSDSITLSCGAGTCCDVKEKGVITGRLALPANFNEPRPNSSEFNATVTVEYSIVLAGKTKDCKYDTDNSTVSITFN